MIPLTPEPPLEPRDDTPPPCWACFNEPCPGREACVIVAEWLAAHTATDDGPPRGE
jgi:hypothetical protein